METKWRGDEERLRTLGRNYYTVAELIELLKTLPQDLKVCAEGYYGDSWPMVVRGANVRRFRKASVAMHDDYDVVLRTRNPPIEEAVGGN